MSAHKGLRAKVEGRGRIIAAAVGIAALVAVGLGGSAVADRDQKATIGSTQIKDGGVYSPDLHNGAVRSLDVRDGGIHLNDLSPWLRDGIAGSCTSATGVDYAVNSGGEWAMAGQPFNKRQATAVVDGNRSGRVYLATYPNGSYADAGVIVLIGTVAEHFDADGNLKTPKVRGPYTDQTAINLYADTNDDGGYLSFDDNGVFDGTYNTAGDDTILFSVDDSTTRTELDSTGAGAVADDALLWAWVGVSGDGGAQTAALTKVDGRPLTVC